MAKAAETLGLTYRATLPVPKGSTAEDIELVLEKIREVAGVHEILRDDTEVKYPTAIVIDFELTLEEDAWDLRGVVQELLENLDSYTGEKWRLTARPEAI